MESCEAVEREIEKVLLKFGGVNDHFERTISKQMTFISNLKEQFENGNCVRLICVHLVMTVD